MRVAFLFGRRSAVIALMVETLPRRRRLGSRPARSWMPETRASTSRAELPAPVVVRNFLSDEEIRKIFAFGREMQVDEDGGALVNYGEAHILLSSFTTADSCLMIAGAHSPRRSQSCWRK